MNIKWTGSLGLAVVAALAGACGGGGGSSGGGRGVSRRLPLWANQFRVPPSNHLRSVRFADAQNGMIAGFDTVILRTSDGGQTWVQQEHRPENRGGNILALDAEFSSVQAVGDDGTGLGRFWYSEDSINWKTADAPGSGSRYTAVDIFIASGAGLPAVVYYLRENGDLERRQGATLQTGDTMLGGSGYALVLIGLSGIGYAAGSATGGTAAEIRRTADFGANWGTQTLTANRLGVLRDLSMGGFNAGFACGDGGTVIFTGDGATWNDGDPGDDLPGTIDFRGIHFPVDSATGWVVGEAGNIWKTVDGGVNWTQQAVGLTVEDLYDIWFVSNNIGYAVGNNGTVLKCVNGTTWSTLPTPPVDPLRFNAIDFSRDGRRGLAVGNTFGGASTIYRTTDGGTTWTDFSAGAPVVHYTGAAVPRFGSGAVAYVCGASGTILRHDGFGSGVGTWTAMTGGSGALNAILFPDDDDHGVCVGDANGIFYTDVGTTSTVWTPATAPPASNYKTVTAVRQGGTVRVYAGGSSGVVSGSLFPTPGVWTAFPAVTGTPTVQALQGVYDGAALADVLFAGGAAAGPAATLHRLQIGAVSWTARTTASTVPPNGLAFINSLEGWWVGDRIYTTLDGGVTWTLSPDHTSDLLRAVWMDANGATGYAAGDNGTILKTVTGGQ